MVQTCSFPFLASLFSRARYLVCSNPNGSGWSRPEWVLGHGTHQPPQSQNYSRLTEFAVKLLAINYLWYLGKCMFPEIHTS